MHTGDLTVGTLTLPATGMPAVVWRLGTPWLAISSAPLGGGLGLRSWIVNAQVDGDWNGDDPAAELSAAAAALGLDGPGIGFLTAADVGAVATAADGGVRVDATVGLAHPSWAAEGVPEEAATDVTPADRNAYEPGTINVVALVPARLSDAALVNAVATAAEAKAQALSEVGMAGTGTPTDATAVLCPPGGPVEPYGGPRSRWGARLARAVHAAVLDGSRR